MEVKTWIQNIRKTIHVEKPLLTQHNGHWEVQDRLKSWEILGSRLFDSHLDAFKECAIDVLSEINPKFELPKEDRLMANIRGKVLKYSDDIRKGLAETLVLMGNYPEYLKNCTALKPKHIVYSVLNTVLDSNDWMLWASLNNLLPTLAEANPDCFLSVIEKLLRDNTQVIEHLYQQEGNGISGGNYMTGLLWALEALAWEEECLVKVTLLLGELASLDPGGTWANRPINSIISIFLPWYPQTLASIEKRKVAIKTLNDENPNIAWRVLLNLLPDTHQTTIGSNKPTWRHTIPDDFNAKIKNEEYWIQTNYYGDLIVEAAKTDINLMIELLNDLDHLPKTSFDSVLAELSSEEFQQSSQKYKGDIWNQLNKFISTHRRNCGAKWACPESIVNRIEEIAKKFTPTDPVKIYENLFVNCEVELYEGDGTWKEKREALFQRRIKALQEVYSRGGICKIEELIEVVESSSDIGLALAHIQIEETDDVFIKNNIDKETTGFMSAYIRNKCLLNDYKWVDDFNFDGWTSNQKAKFLSYLPFKKETWKRLPILLGEDENLYWKKVFVPHYSEDENLSYAIEKLLKYNRPLAALLGLSGAIHDKKQVDLQLVADCLMKMLDSSEEKHHNDYYYIVEAIQFLQNNPETDRNLLFRIEWAYLDLLESHRGATPITLENQLSQDPSFFCDLIKLCYRSKKEMHSEKKVTKEKERIAAQAWHLLRKWKKVPGSEENNINEDKLKAWIKAVKKACKESGHYEVALQHIGQNLFYSPADKDGLWINRAVAEELNQRDSEEMRVGYNLAAFNSRGSYTVDPTGAPEKKLADSFREEADAVENAGFSRFADELKKIAADYERQAQQIIDEHKK